MLILVGVTVIGFTGSLNVMDTVVVRGTLVAEIAGTNVVTVGPVVSVADPVVNELLNALPSEFPARSKTPGATVNS